VSGRLAQTAKALLIRSLLTPLYAIHPPHTLAVTSIHLTTRFLGIPLPEDWFLLFDVAQEDITNCAGTIMRLYHDWGVAPPQGTKIDLDSWEQGREGREGRWRRAWILGESRKAVRRWVEEWGKR